MFGTASPPAGGLAVPNPPPSYTKLPREFVSSIVAQKDAARVLPKNKPENVHAVAGALKILADIRMTKAVLDARFARQLGDESRVAAARSILTGSVRE